MWRATAGGLDGLLGGGGPAGRYAVGRGGRHRALLAVRDAARAARVAYAARGRARDADRPAARLLARRRRARRRADAGAARRRPATTPASWTTRRRQSQMQVILAAGLERAYSADWIGATSETRDATVDDYLAFVARVRRAHRRAGQPDRRLPGRLAGDDLRRAASRGRPHADDRRRADRLPGRRRGHPRLGRGARRSQRRPRLLPLGRRPGRRRAQGRAHAQRLHPDQARERGPQARPAALAPRTTSSHLERHRAFETWFKHVQDIPGAFYLWIVEHLFARQRARQAASSRSAASWSTSARIACPLFLLGGERDHITPPRAGLRARRPRADAGARRHAAHRGGRPPRAVHGLARRCGSTGRRCWPASTSAPRATRTVPRPSAARADATTAPRHPRRSPAP